MCICISALHLCDELPPADGKCDFFSWALFLSFACFVSMLAAREEGNVVCLVGLQAKSKVVT